MYVYLYKIRRLYIRGLYKGSGTRGHEGLRPTMATVPERRADQLKFCTLAHLEQVIYVVLYFLICLRISLYRKFSRGERDPVTVGLSKYYKRRGSQRCRLLYLDHTSHLHPYGTPVPAEGTRGVSPETRVSSTTVYLAALWTEI